MNLDDKWLSVVSQSTWGQHLPSLWWHSYWEQLLPEDSVCGGCDNTATGSTHYLRTASAVAVMTQLLGAPITWGQCMRWLWWHSYWEQPLPDGGCDDTATGSSPYLRTAFAVAVMTQLLGAAITWEQRLLWLWWRSYWEQPLVSLLSQGCSSQPRTGANTSQ